jgi:hypothetical protein
LTALTPRARPQVQLGVQAGAAALSLLVLRAELPSADASAMAARHPYLLSLPPEELRAAVKQVGAPPRPTKGVTSPVQARRAACIRDYFCGPPAPQVCCAWRALAGEASRRAPTALLPVPVPLPPLRLRGPQFRRLLLEHGGSDPDALAQVWGPRKF